MKKLLLLVIGLLIFLAVWSGVTQYTAKISGINQNPESSGLGGNVKIVSEESVVISVVKKVSPSVVTIAEDIPQQTYAQPDLGPFGSFFGAPDQLPDQEQQPQGPQNIGSGFVVSTDGLIVTNKHVVSDSGGKYYVITNQGKKYTVQKIYRDPLNDISIVKIDPSENGGQGLVPVTLGDSSKLEVGQLVVAIGTPLGQFSNTVTTGIISGLGRGITAGSQYQGFVEELTNVIQTDAAINPGNSGGPLVNSTAQVIGVNTAVAQGGQNIGFALPINVIKESLKNFNATGQFNRPYLGVAYRLINREVAVMNSLPQGAYVQQVIQGSAADKAGIKQGDIITKIDGTAIQEGQSDIAKIISGKKVGDSLTLTVWRDGKTQDVKATLEASPSQ